MSNALGLDRSGNNNNWTVHSLDMNDDLMLDSPTNNFPTLNPLTKRPVANGILSHGNLKFTSQTGDATVYATMGIPAGQKVYFEVYLRENSNQNFIGVSKDYDNGGGDYAKVGNAYGRKVRGGATVQQYYNGGGDSSGTNLSVNNQAHRQVVNVAVDNVNGRIHYGFQGTWESDPTDNNPAANVTGFDTTVTQFPKISVDTPNDTAIDVVNFGQSSAFAGDRGNANNQDANGIGDFAYSVPAGYLALCTKNLPDVDIVPSKHFNTVLYSGNGGTQSITGFGFQPDWIWDKSRNQTGSHILVDAVRGVGKYLRTNLTNAEVDDASVLTSFDSDGVTVGDINGNATSSSSVMWGWKANGSGSSNTDGTINTTATSANVDAGFSISTYTGTGSNATIGHGLSKAPEMVIVKERGDDTGHWYVWHTAFAATKGFYLNETSALATSDTYWNDTAPTADVFNVGTNTDINGTSGTDTYVAYCFHSVDGYSKFGSYEGNGETGSGADGPFVFTNFRPAFVIIKCTSNADDWHGPYDSKRLGYNNKNERMLVNTSAASNSGTDHIDILSNGFKLRSDNLNQSGRTFIYIAFAETPFKYSNAK